jgi:hypothetical protein
MKFKLIDYTFQLFSDIFFIKKLEIDIISLFFKNNIDLRRFGTLKLS